MADNSDFDDEEGVDEPVLSDGEEPEQEEEVEENPLTTEIVAESLSLLTKTGNGFGHAYIRLDIHGKEITDINILNQYIHLRYVDISMNNLKSVDALNSLSHIHTLKANKNMLKSAALNELPYLQQADFANNKIASLEGIEHDLLETLNLNSNDISAIEGLNPCKLGNLTQLELRGNKLTSTKGLLLPNLKKLYLAENQITQLEDLSRMTQLTSLHLRDNKLVTLDGFTEELVSLQYVNLRKNEIDSYDEVKKLDVLPKLRVLVLRECPIQDKDQYRVEVLSHIQKLVKLDQDPYTEDDVQEANELKEQREEAERNKANEPNPEDFEQQQEEDDDY